MSLLIRRSITALFLFSALLFLLIGIEGEKIRFMIADAATKIEAASWLTLAAADRKDRGLRFTKEASMAKLFASETANAAAYMALQVHGGYGYTKEYKVERLYRDARATTIYEGTSEVQRIDIAREVIKP